MKIEVPVVLRYEDRSTSDAEEEEGGVVSVGQRLLERVDAAVAHLQCFTYIHQQPLKVFAAAS